MILQVTYVTASIVSMTAWLYALTRMTLVFGSWLLS
jgi:hypothetical protein